MIFRRGMGWTSPYLAGEQSGCDPLDTACVNRMVAAQAGAMDAEFQSDLAAFREACNRTWLINDPIYASLGVPRPPNNCDQRDFGLTPAGGYTSNASASSTYTFAHDYPTFTPPVIRTTPAPASVVVTQPAAPAQTPSPAAPSAAPASSYIPVSPGAIAQLAGGSLDVAGFHLPFWQLAAAGVALLFVARGK